MSHRNKISGDPSNNQDIVIRKEREASIVFRFLDSAGDPYNIADDFGLNVKMNDKSTENLIHLDTTSGLTIVDNEITAAFTEENSNVDRYSCFWELINLTTKQTWFTGKFYIVTGESIENTTTEIDSTVNIGEQIIEATITLFTSDFDINNLTTQQLQDLWLLLTTATSFDYTFDFNIQ